jgi:hypothetical protein
MKGRGLAGPFSSNQIAAVMTVGIGSALIPALAPLLLGAMVNEQRLSIVQLGQAATAELFAMGITVGLAGIWLKAVHLRLIAFTATIATVVLNAGTIMVSGELILMLRLMNGICAGVVLWLLIGMLSRAAVPGRLTGLYIGCQAVVTLIFASLGSAFLLPAFGANGGFVGLALIGVLLACAVPFIPQAYAPMSGHAGASLWPPVRGLAALLSIFLYIGGITAIWVYLDPVARRAGYSGTVIGLCVSAGIGMQAIGGWIASASAHRLDPVAMIITGGMVSAAAVTILPLASASPALFVATILVFGFFWGFAVSFQIPFVIDTDPSGRTAMLIGSAQLLGSAAGPALAAWLISGANVGAAPIASAGLFAAGALGVLAVRLSRKSLLPAAA